MKKKYEKFLNMFGLPRFYCYFCDEVIFLTRRGLNIHIKKSHKG